MVVILSLVNVFSSVDLISLFKLLNSIENLFNNILLLTKLRKIAKEEHTARLDFFHQPHNIPVKNAKTRTTDLPKSSELRAKTRMNTCTRSTDCT